MQKFTVFFIFALFINLISENLLAQNITNFHSTVQNKTELQEKQTKASLNSPFRKNKKSKKVVNRFTTKDYDELFIYADSLVTVSDSSLYLYSKDLKVNWQANLVTDNFRNIFIEFDKIYSINKNNFLTTFSIDSGLKDINNSIELESYVLKYPFLFSQLNNTYTMIDLNSKESLWKKNIQCDQTIIFSSAKSTGCLRKNVLSVYDTITGEKLKDVKSSKFKDSIYISSTNSYAFFKSKKNNIFKVNLNSYKLTNTKYSLNNFEFVLRQKELIQVEDNEVQCVDLISEKLKWKSKFETSILDIIHNQNYLLLKLPSKNMTIIDNYNGESVIMFDTKGELNKIHHFYRHKDHLYLINNELKNVTVLK